MPEESAAVAELREQLVVLAAAVTQRDVVIEQLRAENVELRRQLGQNSRNSSKPPSSDGLAKPAPRSLRRRGTRKPGGQDGHPGSTLAPVATPDEVIAHEPGCCTGCGHGLSGALEVGRERRQVVDLPPVRVRVTEHQLIARRCGCGTTTSAPAPAGVAAAPVQYGPRITAIVVYLYVGQFLSRKRTAAALAELFGTPLSPGTVTTMTSRAAAGLDGFTELVRRRLTDAEVVNFDETGLRVAGKLRWVHSASTGRYSLITVHDRRGVKGMDAAGVLPHFGGVAVHDAWAPYDTYQKATHALCGAHLLRELQAVTDLAAHDAPGQWCWATQAANALRELNALVRDALAEHGHLHGVDPTVLADAVHRYRSAAVLGAAATSGRATKTMAKHHALARRMIDRRADYLRFTRDPRVPFDNNAAEREIRMIKLRQKVSGCLRTLTGATEFCAIRSYLATAAKHGRTFLDALIPLAQGRAWLPTTA